HIGHAARPQVQPSFRLGRKVQRSMNGECYQCDHATDDGVPVENAVLLAHAPVGPQGFEEVTVGMERNAADHVAQCRAEEDSQQDAGQAEDNVEESFPHLVLDVRAELDADGAQHQQPQNHHQGQIEAAEAGGVEQWKCEVQRSASGEQPYFVAVPHWTNGTQNGAALRIAPGDEEMDCPGAEIKAVKQHVNSDHHRDDHEPNGCHGYRTSAGVPGTTLTPSGAGSGPCSISRRTRNRNSMESTVYIPRKPRKLNQPLPAETIFE